MILNGKYHLDWDSPYEQSSSSMVYLGMTLDVNTPVILKIVSTNTIALEALQNEYQLVNNLTHKNIIRYTDSAIITHEKVEYFVFVMPYYKNGTLLNLIDARLELDLMGKIVTGVFEGLDYLRSRGIVHRDIKPANILIDDEGNPVICDFSTAFQLPGPYLSEDISYDVSEFFGISSPFNYSTPEYMAPEQYLNRVSFKSDVWSAGMTFFHIFTGILPLDDFLQVSEGQRKAIGSSEMALLYKKAQNLNFKTITDQISYTPYADFTNVIKECLIVDIPSRANAAQIVQLIPSISGISTGSGVLNFVAKKLFSFLAPSKKNNVFSLGSYTSTQRIPPPIILSMGVTDRVCNQCGYSNSRFAKYCVNCASWLVSPTPATINPYNTQTLNIAQAKNRRTVMYAQTVIGKRFYVAATVRQIHTGGGRCTNCGWLNKSYESICEKCNLPLSNNTYYNYINPAFDNKTMNGIVEAIQSLVVNGASHTIDSLDLSRHDFESLDPIITELPNVEYLKLKIREENGQFYPKNLSKLVYTRFLDISGSNISSLPPELLKMPELTVLNLDNLPNLYEIPPEIVQMPALTTITIKDSPIVSPPPEIVTQGVSAIKNYYQEISIEGDEDYLNEIKLILVGEGRVGKSSLMKRLSHPDAYFDPNEESTEGIDIQRWTVKKSEIGLNRDFRINIWDFGGQEIYHSTHQFFLTKRSVYFLVTESRKEDKHEDFYYWLNIIKHLGSESPVFLILNKCDQPTKELPIKEYSNFFSNLIGYHKVSCIPSYSNTIDALKGDLYRVIKDKNILPHIGTPLPKVWIDIRRELEILKIKKIDYISYDDYLKSCTRFGLDDTRAAHLCSFLHDLGVLLHFSDDLILSKYVIVNHEWVTEAVYRLLDDEIILDKKGRFSNDDIKRIWANSKFKDMQGELLALMKNAKFDLCFSVSINEYLAPQMLPVDEVEFEWDSNPETLKFEYGYVFMPKGILTRFIVKSHTDIYNNIFWRYGVMLEYNDARAIIRERYFDRKITIEITGENRKELLGIIRKNITEINTVFNGLEVEEKFPCNCKSCNSSSKPCYFTLTDLQRRKAHSIKTVECSVSYEQIEIESLLEGINNYLRLDKQKLRDFISDGRIEDAINDLEKFLILAKSKETLNDIVMLKANYKLLNKEHFSNRIDHELFTKETAKINFNLLALIDQFA